MRLLKWVGEFMTIRNRRAWIEPDVWSETAAPTSLAASLELAPLTAEILCRRGYSSLSSAASFLLPDHYSPTPPDALPDLLYGAERLASAVAQGEQILIWGDFDVDGQTATALLVDGLHHLGANPAFYVPHRLRESHGMRLDSLRTQLDSVRPTLLVTCDTGISAHEAVDYTKSAGLDVIITDHHDLPPTLPAADAVINPKRLPRGHPLASLPGVGVAYKLMEQVFALVQRAGSEESLLDLVALGIVADVAEQTRDTRYLLQIGLERLRQTERPGLRALMEVAGLDPATLSAADIGFQLGPRLNAAGRLDDARPVVELLTTPDRARAHLLALHLEGLNNQRRVVTRQTYAAAQEAVAADPLLLDWEALVLAHPAWHAGIIGIVAGQLADRYLRPVVLLTIHEDGHARGSARSAPGYDIGAAIAAQADLLTEYGGHPGAAGLSLPADHIPAFRRRLSNTLRETRDPAALPGLTLDAVVSLGEITPELVADLDRLAPFGEGNPPVTLATRDLTLRSASLVGRTQEHRRLTVQDSTGTRRTVLWWNSADQPLPDGPFDLAYHVENNSYRDRPEIQLVLVDYRRAVSAPLEVQRPALEIIDRRGSPSPADDLAGILQQHPDAAVWAEGYRRADSPGQPLDELRACETLVVYSAPSGPQALQEALERIQPARLVLLGVLPPLQALTDVHRRLLELVKYVLNQQAGHTTLSALAGAVAQTRQTVQHALDYCVARGEIEVDYADGSVQIRQGSGRAAADEAVTRAAFEAGAAETAAYRVFFRRAEAAHLAGQETRP